MGDDAPAFVDLHFHGAFGHACADGADAMQAIDDGLVERFGARGYRYLATLPNPATPLSDVPDQVNAVARAAAAGSSCVGVRIEGLFIAPSRRGMWPAAGLALPDPGLLDACIDAAVVDGRSLLRVVDVAPELAGAARLVERACERGVVASIAHTDATFEQAMRAIDAGATLATHTFNAMRPLHHRDPGVLGAVLTDERVTCELICDGQHLHPAAALLAVRAKGPAGVVAVSDASPLAGSRLARGTWGPLTLTREHDRVTGADGGLAGAWRLLDDAAGWLVGAGCEPEQARAAASTIPSRVLQLP